MGLKENIFALFPRGKMWRDDENNGPFERIAEGLAAETGRLYARINSFLSAIDPRVESELTESWKAATTCETSTEIGALLASTGGQSEAYIKDVLRAAGFGECKIKTVELDNCISSCTGSVYATEFIFVFYVTIEKGDKAAAQKICDRIRPAHTRAFVR